MIRSKTYPKMLDRYKQRQRERGVYFKERENFDQTKEINRLRAIIDNSIMLDCIPIVREVKWVKDIRI